MITKIAAITNKKKQNKYYLPARNLALGTLSGVAGGALVNNIYRSIIYKTPDQKFMARNVRIGIALGILAGIAASKKNKNLAEVKQNIVGIK